MSIAAIIQARMGSSRLPGKVLARIGSTTVIAEVVRRCKAIPGIDTVCCAVPEGRLDDPLADAAVRCGALVYRGHSTDVLARYVGAARMVDARIVMRITADKPLMDPRICGDLLALLERSGADFACNNQPPGWPHGLDCEVFSAALLYESGALATDPEDREHVTPWMRREPGYRSVNLEGPGGDVVDLRWTLDHPEDLEFLTSLFDKLPPPPAMPLYADVMVVLERYPELVAINARWQHLSRYAKTDTSGSP